MCYVVSPCQKINRKIEKSEFAPSVAGHQGVETGYVLITEQLCSEQQGDGIESVAVPALVSLSSGEINKFSPTSGHCVKNDLDFRTTLVSGLVRTRHCHFCFVYLRNMDVGHVQASRVRLS